ncbi:MAG: hypothetical protein MUF60_01570 [Vicinamibacterales bacterium]|nr:hypothetical protein [Vicinamibacterales bacterium]
MSAALLLCLSAVVAPRAAAQEPPVPPLEGERLTPAEVVRLFDAYAVVQAQDALGLDTQQYGAFVASYRALLEARRRHQEARLKIVGELARLTRNREQPAPESALRERLRALDEQEAQGLSAVKAAMVLVEQGLSVEQQARFRVFEEQMERRKLQLMARARQPRPGRRMPPGP